MRSGAASGVRADRYVPVLRLMVSAEPSRMSTPASVERGRAIEVVGAVGVVELDAGSVGHVEGARVEDDGATGMILDVDCDDVLILRNAAVIVSLAAVPGGVAAAT